MEQREWSTLIDLQPYSAMFGPYGVFIQVKMDKDIVSYKDKVHIQLEET